MTKRKNGGILGTSSDASVAQLVEHHVANVIVAGSIPVTRSIFDEPSGASVAQLVEHHVANVIVAGSIPVTRSIFFAFFRPHRRFATKDHLFL